MRQSYLFELFITIQIIIHNFNSLLYSMSQLKKNVSQHAIKSPQINYITKTRKSESNFDSETHRKSQNGKASTTLSQKSQQIRQQMPIIDRESQQIRQQMPIIERQISCSEHQIFYMEDEIYSQEVFNQESEYVSDLTSHYQKQQTQQQRQFFNQLKVQNQQLFYQTQHPVLDLNLEKDRDVFYLQRIAIKQPNQAPNQTINQYRNIELNIIDLSQKKQTQFILQAVQRQNSIQIYLKEYNLYVNYHKPWIIWLISKAQDPKIILLQFEDLQNSNQLIKFIGLQKKTSSVKFYDFFSAQK